MNIRKLSLAIITIAAISPVVASAAPEQAALNACAKAFATSIATPGAAASPYKVNYAQRHVDSAISEYYAQSYTFNLKAQNEKTGTAFASATCLADKHGQVLALTSTGTPTETTLASR